MLLIYYFCQEAGFTKQQKLELLLLQFVLRGLITLRSIACCYNIIIVIIFMYLFVTRPTKKWTKPFFF